MTLSGSLITSVWKENDEPKLVNIVEQTFNQNAVMQGFVQIAAASINQDQNTQGHELKRWVFFIQHTFLV